jgi:hypothetical protein
MKYLWLIGILLVMVGCSTNTGQEEQTPLPTPAADVLQISGVSPMGSRLRITVHSVDLLQRDADDTVQMFLVLADPAGTYSYLLYPANREGDSLDKFDLIDYPLEISLNENSTAVSMWVVAVHNRRYQAAENLGLESLAGALAVGFYDWLSIGDSSNDPLAAVVSASNGTLYEWFACIDVLGQTMTEFRLKDNWNTGTNSLLSADDGIQVIYAARLIDEDSADATPTPVSMDTRDHNGYTLRVDDSFEDAKSTNSYYERAGTTFINQVIDGAYEIRLENILDRSYALSWGSIENAHFDHYIIEAQVKLDTENAQNARYGIWFNYQDDYNFIYFGISARGEYRVAVIESNSLDREIQGWTPHPAINPGATTNILTIETGSDGSYALGINGERVLTFSDGTFDGGSVAFFCYAESTPTVCHLERLHVWEPME